MADDNDPISPWWRALKRVPPIVFSAKGPPTLYWPDPRASDGAITVPRILDDLMEQEVDPEGRRRAEEAARAAVAESRRAFFDSLRRHVAEEQAARAQMFGGPPRTFPPSA
jgi:hypothetical protein